MLIAVAVGYRTPLVVYTATLAAMFTTSALYHRGQWSEAGRRLWKRLDHSMIFLAIAGGYTAYCAIALPPSLAIVILGIVWAGALAGVGLQLLWAAAPRWLSAPSYAALGLVAVFVLPDLLRHGGPAALTLLCAGGAVYLLGALAYAARWPRPVPVELRLPRGLSCLHALRRRLPLRRLVAAVLLAGDGRQAPHPAHG